LLNKMCSSTKETFYFIHNSI
ncbi:hypothetical protein, partial [Plasmodium yoelii yoelii]